MTMYQLRRNKERARDNSWRTVKAAMEEHKTFMASYENDIKEMQRTALACLPKDEKKALSAAEISDMMNGDMTSHEVARFFVDRKDVVRITRKVKVKYAKLNKDGAPTGQTITLSNCVGAYYLK